MRSRVIIPEVNGCREHDKGVALILVMLSLLVLSVLTATIVFTARAETFASYNYKLDTQADYLAKAGIQQALAWFRSSRYTIVSQAQAPTYYNLTSSGDPLYLYTSNASPVRCISGCSSTAAGSNQVQFVGFGSGSSNYPISSVATNFSSDLVNVRVTGDKGNSGTFSINATLLSYQTVSTGAPPSIQQTPMESWLITSHATWTGGSGGSGAVAVAEEQAVVEPIYLATDGNALYGYCSVQMGGSSGTCTDAFNSSLGPYGNGTNATASGNCDSSSTTNIIDTGAGVGANGYVSLSNNVTVSGDVTIGATPTGGSSCCSGSSCGFQGNTSSVLGEVVTGPHINPPGSPSFPGIGQAGATFPGTALSYNSASTLPQTAAGVAPASGTINPGNATYTQPCIAGYTCDGSAAKPYLIKTINLSSPSDVVTLYGGPSVDQPIYYDIDSISDSGQSQIGINGYVVLNVKSTLSLAGKGVVNGITQKPEALQINYAGSSAAAIKGNGGMSALITAPNAEVDLGGGGSAGYMIGAIQAANVKVQGGYPIHYDVQLNRLSGTLGTMVVSAYSRRKM